jgi:hypothetical protein
VTERQAPPQSTLDEAQVASPAPAVPAPRRAADDPPERMSPLAIAAVVVTTILSMTWFFISWAVLNSPLTDAIGETAGSLAVVLLVVSIVGVARRR